MSMKLSAARKVKPARVRSNEGVKKLWLKSLILIRQDLNATREFAARSAELLSALVLMSYAQLIDDVKGVTLASASSLDKEIDVYGGNKDAARKVGQLIAKRAADKGITDVVFDRGGYIFHGRVKELAEGAREGGLKF